MGVFYRELLMVTKHARPSLPPHVASLGRYVVQPPHLSFFDIFNNLSSIHVHLLPAELILLTFPRFAFCLFISVFLSNFTSTDIWQNTGRGSIHPLQRRNRFISFEAKQTDEAHPGFRERAEQAASRLFEKTKKLGTQPITRG